MSPPRSACRACARAKARCIYAPPSSLYCVRCGRLGKECVPQTSQIHPAPVRKNRVDHLEQEVQDLRNALAAQNIIKLDVNPSIRTTESISTQLSARGKRAEIRNERPSPAEADLRPQYPIVPAISPGPVQTAYDTNIWPAFEEAERLINIYREQLSVHFPFVVPPAQPVAEIYRDRPFLFQAMIMAASYQNRSLQYQRGTAFTREAAAGLLVDGIKNLDLLQGLLVHIGWYHCYLPPSSQITNLLQLAIALLADLGLNKPGHFNDRRKLIFDPSRSSYGFSTNIRILSNDERRALLGCFYVSSMVSTFFRRVNALEYTSYMANELRELLECAECPTDQLLGHLIRVQNEVEHIGKTVPYDQPTYSDYGTLAMMTTLRVLNKRLCDLHDALPLDMKNNDLLLLQRHASSIFVHEVGLYDDLWQDMTETSAFHRLNTMSSCLKAVKSFFNCFLSLSPHLIRTLPYSLWYQLAYALLIASRLSLAVHEGWDSDLVQQELSFSETLDLITKKLDEPNGDDNQDGVLYHIRNKIQRIKGWFENQKTLMDTPDGYPQIETLPEWHYDGLSGDFWEDLINGF